MIGGRTALRGLFPCPPPPAMEFWVTREFVMEAIRWRGESETPDAAAAISSGVPGGPPDGNRVEPGPLTEKIDQFSTPWRTLQ